MSDLQRVGPVPGGTGTPVPFTAGITGASRVADAHSRYMQSCLEGRVFIMDSDSVTLAAANATKSAMGTAKFINGFLNPRNSGVNAVILIASIATVSGTPAGPFFYNFYPIVGNLSSAVTGTIRSAFLASTATGSKMTPQTGVVLATTPADTTALTQLSTIGGPAAIAAGAGVYSVADEVAGRIIVPPGFLFGIMCAGAGTTHIVQSTLQWEEVPALT
jgi:hypothetical protein